MQKLMPAIYIDSRNKALVSGAFPEIFIFLESISNNEMKEKLSEIKGNNEIEKVAEANFSVISFNHNVI